MDNSETIASETDMSDAELMDAMREYFLEPAEMKVWNKDTKRMESVGTPLMPTPEGFLVSVDMTHREFAERCKVPAVQRLVEICKMACKDFAIKHGLSGAYNSAVWDKYMRNEHGYVDRSEVVSTREVVLAAEDREYLERLGYNLLEAQ